MPDCVFLGRKTSTAAYIMIIYVLGPKIKSETCMKSHACFNFRGKAQKRKTSTVTYTFLNNYKFLYKIPFKVISFCFCSFIMCCFIYCRFSLNVFDKIGFSLKTSHMPIFSLLFVFMYKPIARKMFFFPHVQFVRNMRNRFKKKLIFFSIFKIK